MQRVYVLPVGTNGVGLVLPANQQIAGLLVDNPSGSWLLVTGIGDYVPPFTLGWTREISPTQLTLDVRYVDSPSGTPSQSTGEPASVTLYDYPQPNSPGYASGAGGYQTPAEANKLTRFDAFELTETPAPAAVTITPAPGFRFVLLRWRPYVGAGGAGNGLGILRAQARITMIDGVGAGLFPSAVLSPEQPTSDFLTPTARQLGVGVALEIGGMIADGGGRTQFVSYLEYMNVRDI